LSPLAADEIRVVPAALDTEAAIQAARFETLSDDERQRAARFVFDVHRRRFIAARGLLRERIAGLLGAAPEALRFAYGVAGKPSLAWPETSLHFNVSHSGDRAVLAFSHALELGVDIEKARDDVDHVAISERFFSPAERRALEREPAERRSRAFFEIWTRKEAFVKARGGGLTIALDSFDVSLGEPARLLRIAGLSEVADVARLETLPAPDGYCAAIAILGRGGRLQLEPAPA
jgi:4'-phosphopantetheinyl transferase